MTAPYAPFWVIPSTPGQLSNKRGANTGADAMQLRVKYFNPKATGDAAGAIRVISTRNVVSGTNQTPQTAWDSGYVGTPPTSPVPAGGISTQMGSVVYNGRIYAAPMLGGSSTSTPPFPTALYSAPITGPSVGTWRQETSIVWNVASGGGLSSLTTAGNFIYACDSAANIAYAPINPDGTIGAWITSSSKPTQSGQIIGGNVGPSATVPNQGFLMIFGGQGNIGTTIAFTTVQNVGLNPDGSLQGWVNGTALPAARASMGLFYNPIAGYVIAVGGNDASATLQSTVWHAPVTGLGAVGTWVLTDPAIPAVKNASGVAFDYTNNTLWVLGGNSLGAVSSNYSSILGGTGVPGAWTTGTVLATGTISPGCFVGTGGHNPTAAGGSITTVQTLSGGAWVSGAQTLTTGSLGTGASLTTNADGSQTWGFEYGAFGPAQIFTLNDGDQITLSVQFVDANSGDPSPISLTVVKIGQAPAISNLAVNVTNDGRPTISFNYSAGAGGDTEFSFRITVAPNGFDSGVRYDSANSVQVLSAPYWPTATLQTITVTVVSRDSPMGASTNQTSATLGVTPTLTAPGTPSGLTATPNNALGLIALAWTNNAPAGTTPGNLVYYRRNGTSTWFLLADLVGAQTSYNAMDQIALAVGYDFAVSQVDNNIHSESPLSNIVSNSKIDPVAGGYSSFLHIGGQGTVHFAPILVQGSPNVAAEFDTAATLPFQQLTPTMTLGVAHYAKLQLKILVPNLTIQKQIMDVLATAYLGNVIYFRDGFGAMIVVQLDPEQTEVYMPPLAREQTLSFTQVPNQFQPSAVQGLATGYLQQAFNSVVPLDPSEAIL